jgi:uncharacterized membrane protein YfcA
MEIKKLLKLIAIIFFVWLLVTYIPNDLLKKWWYILFVFADFYVIAALVKKRTRHDRTMNTILIGTIILTVVTIVINRIGF